MPRFLLRHLILAACVLATVAAASDETPLRVVRDVSLPADVLPVDVRWASDEDVYVTLGAGGVVRMPVGRVDAATQIVPPAAKGGFAFPSHIGAGPEKLVVAAPFGGFAAVELRGGKQHVAPGAYATIIDIDARDDQVAILGAERGDVQGLSEDGAIAWVGPISTMSGLRPLLKGRSTPGGKDVARCGMLENGGIRFMNDGSIVVFTGVEDGVYRYDAKGKLLRTWPTADWGVLSDCAVSDEELMLLARDFGRRTQWLASRVTVDDILPWNEGAALLLRRVGKNSTTRWDLLVLPFNGRPRKLAVPIEMASPRAHVRADARGDRIVLLAFDYPLPRQKSDVPPRMIVLSAGR